MGYPPKLDTWGKKWIPRNHSNGHPSNLLFFDTETICTAKDYVTDAEYHSLRLGHAIALRSERGKLSRRKTCDFTTQYEFWDFVESRLHDRLPLWVFAHNLPFDISIVGFWELLSARVFGFRREEIDMETDGNSDTDTRRLKGFFVDEGPPTVISVLHKNGCKVNFVCTLNYWRMSLSQLGESVGYPKIEIPEFVESDEIWFPYCQRDVAILEKSVLELMTWHRENDLGRWGFTQASMSMNAYRHRFMPCKIEQHENDKVKEIERDSYYGGRLELYYQGTVNETVYACDVNSMYPALMRERDYPCELIDFSNTVSSRTVEPSELSDAHIAEVLLDTDSETFPLRTPKGTIFPVGRFWTTLSGPELTRAIATGSVIQVGRWSLYRLTNLFGEYVDYFYSMRQGYKQDGNKIGDTFAKIFMNSLYGKFGQKTAAWESISDNDNADANQFAKMSESEIESWLRFTQDSTCAAWDQLVSETGETYELRKIGNHWQMKVERLEHKRAFPAIASFVTAYGRELVNHLRNIAGHSNTYYVVTDAVYVNQQGYDNLCEAGLIDEKKLGKLAVESVAPTAEFRAIHHYTVGDKSKFGSRKSKAIDLGDGKVLETHFEGLQSLIKRRGDGTVKIYPVEKQFTLEHPEYRGVVKPNGWIEPPTIGE